MEIETLILILVVIVAFVLFVVLKVRPNVKGGTKKSSKYAYVTMLIKGDGYVPGALALAQSLKQSGTTADLICMVTNDVSENAKADLATLFKVKVVPKIEHESKLRTENQERIYSKFISELYTKWQCLKFKEYDKVMFVDADIIFTENVDHLFDLPAPAAVFASPWMKPWEPTGLKNLYGKPNKITPEMAKKMLNENTQVLNGGLVLLKPDMKVYKRILDILKGVKVYPTGSNFSSADEQIIVQATSDLGHTWTVINPMYNMMVGHYKVLDPGTKEPIGYHYYGEKPWMQDRGNWPDLKIWYEIIDTVPAAKKYLRS